ncbi:MAG: 50S ribosomal protein L5 [Candidatus Bathyarchaeia archaeon]
MSEEEIIQLWETNPMLKPRIEKVVVNMCVGKSGEILEKASKVLEELTGQKPCKRKAKRTIRDFGIRRGEPIACVVTLRKERAVEFLKKALYVVGYKLPKSCFDKFGNFAFGIKEHIEIPGVKYDPEVGIFGMDVCVSLCRAGWRVKYRRRARSKIGSRHLLTRDEAVIFMKNFLGVEIS